MVAGAGSGEHGSEHRLRCAGRVAEAAEDDRGSDQQVPLGPFHVARRTARWPRSAASPKCCFLEWDFGNLDYGPIAARIKDAKPDFVWVGAIGLEGNQLLDAMSKIDYAPQEHFYMYPAPGPMSKSPLAKNALSMTVFEEHAPFTDAPGAKEFIALYHERAAKAGIPDTSVEGPGPPASLQPHGRSSKPASVAPTASTTRRSPRGSRKNGVDTNTGGHLRFDGPSNYGDDLMRVKQVQNGHWVTVYPKVFAAPGATLQVQ